MAHITRTNTPLLEPTLFLIAGILAFVVPDREPDHFTVPALVLGLIISVTLLIFRRFVSWRRLVVWSLFYCVGTGLAAIHRTDPMPAMALDSERLTFIGRIDDIPQQRGRWNRSEATLFCYADTVTGDWIPLNNLKTRLYTDTASVGLKLQMGDIIRFRGRIFSADSGSYDLYMRRTRGITARCFTWKVERLEGDTSLYTQVELFRNYMGNKLLTDDRKDAGSIMQALAIGNQGEIDPELRDSYTRTGVAHLLSVSGLHVGIIFMIINLLLGWLRLFRRGYIILGILVIGILCGYAVLTGLSPAVIRAVIMFSLLQVGLMLSRYTNSFNTLCAAALVLLLWNPYYLYHIGFQLSFAAMVGIITLYQPLARLWMPRYIILRWLWSLTLVGVTAQVGTFPLIIYHFGQLQLAGLLLNPVIWFTVPVIIGGSLLYLVSGWGWVFDATVRTTEWQNAVIQGMGQQPWIAVTGIDWPWWACAGLYAVIIAFIILVNRKSATKTRSYFSDTLDVAKLSSNVRSAK